MKRTDELVKLVALVGIGLTAFGLVAADPTPRVGHRTRPARFTKPSGGLVERAYTGNVVRVINAQAAIPGSAVSGAVGTVRLRSQIPVELSPAGVPADASPMGVAASAVRADGVGAAIVLVDRPGEPLLVASPDGRWATVNISPIAGEPERASGRLEHLMWNALARALGAGWSGDAASVLGMVAGVEGLDALPSAPSPAEQNAIIDAAKAHGVGLLTFATYRTACSQGWAPDPTNDVQRAIRDEVYAIPSEPMKIEFDPKRGR